MPTVNIYSKDVNKFDSLGEIVEELKELLSIKLTCGEFKLTSKEISVRFIKIEGGGMIGEVELEITAAAFKERVEKQDEICREVMRWIMEKNKNLGEVKVWLKLSELGHSW